MKTWVRAGAECQCGCCGQTIPTGDPLLILRVALLTFPKYRCGTCAGSPVPPDLPALEPREPVQRMTPLWATAKDWKQHASGDTEEAAQPSSPLTRIGRS